MASKATKNDVPDKTPGAWLLWPMVEQLCQLDLRPPSTSRVFLAVLFTSARYGGKPARMGVQDLVAMTGLGERTVKSALSMLLKRGLLRRKGRYRQLEVVLGEGSLDKQKKPTAPKSGGASLSAPRRCRQACTSATSINVSVISISSNCTFSSRQVVLLERLFTEATELLGDDAGQLTLSAESCESLCLPLTTTYSQAYETIACSGDRRKARDFVRAVLAMRKSPMVEGEELDLSDG